METLTELLSEDEYATQQLMEVRGKMGSKEYWDNWESAEMIGVEALLGTLVFRSSENIKALAQATAKEYAMRKVLVASRPKRQL